MAINSDGTNVLQVYLRDSETDNYVRRRRSMLEQRNTNLCSCVYLKHKSLYFHVLL